MQPERMNSGLEQRGGGQDTWDWSITQSGRCNGLSVFPILHIAGCEDALHICFQSFGICFNVATLVHVYEFREVA